MDRQVNEVGIQFNKVADGYDFVAELFNNNDFFTSNMTVKKGKVLDIGCGSGILALELAKHYEEVIGIDISDEFLSLAEHKRKRPNITYTNMNAESLHFEKKFDLIVSRTTFHHLNDIPSVLTKMKELLNDEGKIVILDNVSKVETPATFVYIIGAFQEFIPNCFKFGVKSAVRIFKHSTSKKWLEHLATDKYLSEQKYNELYGKWLPNCRLIRKGCFMGVIWDKQ